MDPLIARRPCSTGNIVATSSCWMVLASTYKQSLTALYACANPTKGEPLKLFSDVHLRAKRCRIDRAMIMVFVGGELQMGKAADKGKAYTHRHHNSSQLNYNRALAGDSHVPRPELALRIPSGCRGAAQHPP